MSRQKAFTRTAVLVFIGSSLITGIYTAWRTNLWNGVAIGLLFGFIITSIGSVLVVLSYFTIKRIKPVATAVDQERTLVIIGSLGEVFSWCVDYLKAGVEFKDVAAFEDQGTVKARAGMSFASWGENITVTCRSLPDGFVEVKIKSKPRYRTTVLDYGKNLRNVETIAKALQGQFLVQR